MNQLGMGQISAIHTNDTMINMHHIVVTYTLNCN